MLSGALLHEAVATLVVENRLFKGAAAELRQQLREHELVRQLVRQGRLPRQAADKQTELVARPGDLHTWLVERIQRLGVEHSDDLELLNTHDLLPEPITDLARMELNRNWPLTIDLGDTSYEVTYNFTKNIVTLHRTMGDRKEPPAPQYLPAFRGFGIEFVYRGKRRIIRSR